MLNFQHKLGPGTGPVKGGASGASASLAREAVRAHLSAMFTHVFCRAVLLGAIFAAIPASAALAQSGKSPRQASITLVPSDGVELAREALADGAGLRWGELQVNDVGISSSQVTFFGTARLGMMACDVQISGRPILIGNYLGLTDVNLAAPNPVCSTIVGRLATSVRDAIRQNPWDLAGRLALAARDSTLPGPRLRGFGCPAPQDITLRSVRAAPSRLTVDLLISRSARMACSTR